MGRWLHLYRGSKLLSAWLAKYGQHIWPRRLLGQTLLLVFLAFLLALSLSLGWQYRAHQKNLELYSQRIPLRHMATVSELLINSPPEQWRNLLRAWRRPGIKLKFSANPKLRLEQSKEEVALHKELENLLGEPFVGSINLLSSEELQANFDFAHHAANGDPSNRNMPNPRFERQKTYGSMLLAEIKISDKLWLQMRSYPPRMLPRKHFQSIVFTLLAIGSVLLVLVWRLRKITQPLSALAQAANNMGRGQAVAPVQEQGPEDIQDTIKAFNDMNARVERFVDERTRMLAALSHDLRTPMTSIRLRLEMMEPSPEREKLLENLAEMTQMSEGTLSFIRDGSDNEPEQRTDISALLESLCDDIQDQGHSINLRNDENIICRVKPIALKRALNNLLENAVRYGESAEVKLSVEKHGGKRQAVITIQDKGTGIPVEALQKVFDPFYRVESSRSRSTGGVGLGLSIARQLIAMHGGRLQLENTTPGLLVTVSLPIRP